MSLLHFLTTQHPNADQDALVCNLCAHRCVLRPTQVGSCGAIQHHAGALRSLVFGQPAVLHVDPIERKPLYHVLPGTRVLSLGTLGCNMRCSFCQNWRISQERPGGEPHGSFVSPEEVVAAAQAQGCQGIAFTYNEPTISLDYAAAIMALAKQAGLCTVFKSNGYMTPEAISALDGLLDAVNVDLKGFDDRVYRQVCGARLQPVCDAIRILHQRGIWIEVTTLLIPGLNDGEAELRALTAFLAGISPNIPWHVWRFHPDYRMRDRPWTPVDDLDRAARIGIDAGLAHVYASNTPGDPRQQTLCPGCGTELISRDGLSLVAMHMIAGTCAACGYRLPGIFADTWLTLV